ncbi:MAG: exodeoxyribonuclease V subunit gamma, partial [Pontibacterium sp.]
QPVTVDDESLVIHRCHSPLREVEVLHDQLLARFEATPDLTPRDVIVMVPDVGRYAPYIISVFGNQPENRTIPYSISDQSSAQESPLLQNVQRLLCLVHSRFSVTDLLEILELPATLRAFGLSESGFQLVRRWVIDAQVRWGLDDEHQASWDVPSLGQNSWQFGLDRMMTGYSMGADAGLWQSIAPFAEVEGLEAEALGSLSSFVTALRWVVTTFTGDASHSTWRDHGLALLESFFAPDADELFAIDHAMRLINRFTDELVEAEYDSPLSGEIFVDYLKNGLSQQPSSHRFMVGAVNFCTLMPMRSIPFKQVCLLGMNDGDYPRSMPPLGFDLIASQPTRGDRSRRDDDRYLFLEAMLSAQEQLYISYIGAS